MLYDLHPDGILGGDVFRVGEDGELEVVHVLGELGPGLRGNKRTHRHLPHGPMIQRRLYRDHPGHLCPPRGIRTIPCTITSLVPLLHPGAHEAQPGPLHGGSGGEGGGRVADVGEGAGQSLDVLARGGGAAILPDFNDFRPLVLVVGCGLLRGIAAPLAVRRPHSSGHGGEPDPRESEGKRRLLRCCGRLYGVQDDVYVTDGGADSGGVPGQGPGEAEVVGVEPAEGVAVDAGGGVEVTVQDLEVPPAAAPLPQVPEAQQLARARTHGPVLVRTQQAGRLELQLLMPACSRNTPGLRPLRHPTRDPIRPVLQRQILVGPLHMPRRLVHRGPRRQGPQVNLHGRRRVLRGLVDHEGPDAGGGEHEF
mmetsp:Transcript_60528/g.162385  ORF Transcript_60528/g.162385 Transcript_60528/m.162385 type:complete len:365 (+) Transcript_60528:1363-2457(+)